MKFDVDREISRILSDDRELSRRTIDAIESSLFVVEAAYVRQAPGMDGDFKQGIQTERVRFMEYAIRSTAKRREYNYPLALYTGTGKMRGKPDQGYTTGHVRAGTVAYGIGGIRPNKAAKRAVKDVKKKFIHNYVSKALSRELKRK